MEERVGPGRDGAVQGRFNSSLSLSQYGRQTMKGESIMDSWMVGWTFAVSEEYNSEQCKNYARLTADLAETFRREREVWTDSAATWQTYMRRAQYMTVKYMERAQQLEGKED
jgi:hypothetical protein